VGIFSNVRLKTRLNNYISSNVNKQLCILFDRYVCVVGSYWTDPLSLTYNIINGPNNSAATTLLTSTAVQSIIASSIKVMFYASSVASVSKADTMSLIP